MAKYGPIRAVLSQNGYFPNEKASIKSSHIETILVPSIPKELHKRLVDLAIQERRSLTDQIIYMLEKGLKKVS